MVSSYDDIMGEPMDVNTHPARQMPPATQSYAGDVLPMPSTESSRASAIAGQASNLLGSITKSPVSLTNVTPMRKPSK